MQRITLEDAKARVPQPRTRTKTPRIAPFALGTLLGIVLLAAAFMHTRINGDGLQYVMMAHGFAHHGTPELTPSDIADVLAMPDELAGKTGMEKWQFQEVQQKALRDHEMPMGYYDGKSWGLQAVHFWMYSLLAAPLYALVEGLGLRPAAACVALNCLIFTLTARCILRWYPRAGLAEIAVLALLGPVIYLRWTGPEVFSACCAFVATLALLRRDLALAALLAGLGATQNPSVGGLIAAAGAYRVVLALRPAWVAGPAAPRQPMPRNALLAAAGVVLAALPFAYNKLVFGVPSIIAVYFTDRTLVSWQRLHSFFFDLNQGMAVGFPGLLLALAVLPFLLEKRYRLRWLACAGAAALLSVGLALPTLSTTNWNAGCFVILRYAYWGAAPLIAACIFGMTQLPAARRNALAGGVVLCQAFAMWQAGWPGGNNLVHGVVANWVLDHAPGLYNPDPEIFQEREQHEERFMPKDTVIVHRGAHGPTKLMRYWTNTAASGGICPAGQTLVSGSVALPSGWEYFNAPFACAPAAQTSFAWQFDAAHAGNKALLEAGWSIQEGAGIWTEGTRSVLHIPLPKGRVFRRLGIAGVYLQPSTTTGVTVNGIDLGRIRLDAGPFTLPAGIKRADALTIELRHERPMAPASLGKSDDTRLLSFYLQSISMDSASGVNGRDVPGTND